MDRDAEREREGGGKKVREDETQRLGKRWGRGEVRRQKIKCRVNVTA
jgi:hypothetical protein